MNELYHHGVKGQKWGVRRYQNKDGSLTPTGKLRIKRNSIDDEFSATEQMVKKRLTNRYSGFNKKNIDIQDVKARGNLTDIEAIRCSALAVKKFNEASKLEPKITQDVVESVSRSGGKMYGLEYRLKQPTSIGAKIGSDSKDKGLSFTDASNGIKDAIRYTAVSDDKNFVRNYHKIKNDLNEKGYVETRCKNYFNLYDRGESMHKSIQCTYKNKDGYEFELQFQTPSSQAAKELKIPIYEERRKAGITEQRAKELESQMRDLAERVPNPKNVSSIGAR